MKFLCLHSPHQVCNQFCLWYDFNRAHQIAQNIHALARTLRNHQIFDIHNSNDVIHIIIVFSEHRQSTEAFNYRFVEGRGDCHIIVKKYHVVTWNHNLSYHRVAKFNNGFNELTLFVLDNTVMSGCFNYPQKFLFADKGTLRKTLALNDDIRKTNQQTRSNA